MKQNKCMQCHGLNKDKDAPALSKIAAKYKGKADAESKLIQHLTSSPKVKLADGTEEEHKVIKTTPAKDLPQIKKVITYILSL
jgi:cytochrome c